MASGANGTQAPGRGPGQSAARQADMARLLGATRRDAELFYPPRFLVMGDSGVGKSHLGFYTLPRPLAVADCDVRADEYTSRADVPKGVIAVPTATLADLTAHAQLVATGVGPYAGVRAYFVEMLHYALRRSTADLGIDQSDHNAENALRTSEGKADRGKSHNEHAAAVDELAYWLRLCTARGIGVYATVAAGLEMPPGVRVFNPALAQRVPKGVTRAKLRYLFGAIIDLRDLRNDKPAWAGGVEARVVKGAALNLPDGTVIEGFDAARDLAPYYTGARRVAPAFARAEPAHAEAEDLLTLLVALGSDRHGGIVPFETAKAHNALARRRDPEKGHRRECLAAIRALLHAHGAPPAAAWAPQSAHARKLLEPASAAAAAA